MIKIFLLLEKFIICAYCGCEYKAKHNSTICNRCPDCRKIESEINELKRRHGIVKKSVLIQLGLVFPKRNDQCILFKED